jgi:serine/threonine-protein kinase
MDSERWERVKELFEAALEREEPERLPFLVQACPNDEALRREVESLLAGHNQAGDFMQTGAACQRAAAVLTQASPPSTFSPSEIISHRFKVLRSLGHGGMGEVYEARDLDRDVQVALKTILPEIAADPKTLARFKQEIEMALRVAHRNVCRVHDLERHQPPAGSGKPEVVFLTMELLDGETLADRLRRQGRMTCAEALPLIRQMADGLAAAHKVGVVHCDFKPGNVMLVSEGSAALDSGPSTPSGGPAKIAPEGSTANRPLRAVITDFGLARAMRPTITRETLQKTLSTGGQLVGTLAYMAPEQLEGRPATPASDVYALGLVAYEMITGQQPFSGPTPLAGAYQRLNESPPSPRSLAPELDPSLESVVLRCLETKPAARYANASEVVVALSAPGYAPFARRRRFRGAPARSAAIAVGVLILTAVLIASSPRAREAVRSRFLPPPIPSRKNLVVLPFKATDAPAEDRARCDGLTETVTAELGQAASLQVASAEFVREHHINDIKAARGRFGANLALSASWQHVGELARINLSLVDTETGRTLRSDTVDAPVGNVFSLQDQVVLHALRMLQVQLSRDKRKDLTTHGTEVLTAYDFYVQGVGYLQRYEKPENMDLAINLFQRAISEDANNAQAQAALAQAYLLKYNATKDPQWVEKSRAAVKAAEGLNSRLPDVQLAIGFLRQRTGDYVEALAALNRTLALDPENVDASQHLGQVYDLLGRAPEAEQVFRSAISIRPACWSCYNELGIFLENHNRFGEAAQAFQKVIELTPDNPWGYTNFGNAYLYLGEFGRAEDTFRRGLSLTPQDPNAAASAAVAAFYLGRYQEDVHYSELAIRLRPQQYGYWGNLADAYRLMPGGAAQAASTYRKAIALAEQQLRVNPNDAQALGRLALFYARTGEKAEAQHYLAAALKNSHDDWDTLDVACLVHLEAGERREALKWLGLAVRAGYPRPMLVADPELAGLRSEPEFASFVEKAIVYR